jgi:flagellar biosynthetic protein FlhB
MSEDAEKVSEASPDKKRRARGKGDVPISQEANTAAALIGFLLAFLMVLPQAKEFGTLLRSFLLHPEGAGGAILEAGTGAAILAKAAAFLLPLAGLPAVAVVAALALQQAIVFAPQRVKPEIKKINPVDNAKKKYGGQGLIEFLRNAAKISVLCILGGVVLSHEALRLLHAHEAPAAALFMLLRRELLVMVALGASVATIFALIDLPVVRMQRDKRLKMSQQEVRDESKETEGNQELKGQRRKRAEKIAFNRMMSDVKTADVVIVNPVHYAVALKWDKSGKDLPRCVAKGTDDIALRLRMAAHEAGVPIKEDPPCARALHASVELGDTIRSEHFAAVAAALRFAERMRSRRRITRR